LISSLPGDSARLLTEWRRACERLYKYFTLALSTDGYGNGVSVVLTDSLCNQHLTSSGCFERAVRLPAAVKAAKEAGAGSSNNIKLIPAIEEKYLELAEKKVATKAHTKSYLKLIKSRCMSVPADTEVVHLTEDSDGNGGEDTSTYDGRRVAERKIFNVFLESQPIDSFCPLSKTLEGSRGTWMAALAGVGAAVKAVDMITTGECVNVFCITRPPGHHAGRELHPMKAVSNGFCILNTAACAALYATSTLSEGGPGLKRVCIIDIDVHHGNGTQDILCSTYDPRFLYVSVHAGGAHVNGIDPGDDAGDQAMGHHLGRNATKGIYPGRCGDTSPHPGVLNIPLGNRVTSHALGTALISKVTPAVEAFSPELIIVSTGFDAHKNDPLGLGGLCAEDFGTLTEVICQLAHKSCGGRVLSVLEGGYGVPCCRQQENVFLPENLDPDPTSREAVGGTKETAATQQPEAPVDPSMLDPSLKPLQVLDLGDDLPSNMMDDVPYALGKRLEKCHAEGFMQCVREHVRTLAKCNKRN
jgi:acetoin utilization deacetylase AcuC-like enzyme